MAFDILGAAAAFKALGTQFFLVAQVVAHSLGLGHRGAFHGDMHLWMVDEPFGPGVEQHLVVFGQAAAGQELQVEGRRAVLQGDRGTLAPGLARGAKDDRHQSLLGEGEGRGTAVGEHEGLADALFPAGVFDLHVAAAHGLGPRGGIEVEDQDVLAARRLDPSGEVGPRAVGGDTEGELVVLGVDGQAQVGGLGIAVGKVDEVDVVSAEALPAVGDEIERVAVGMEEGEFLVACGVDATAEVLGTAPVAVLQPVAAPDVGAALTALAVGGIVEPLPVGAHRGLRLPGTVAVDVVAQPLHFPLPALRFPLAHIQVAVGISAGVGDAREIEHVAVGRRADPALGAPLVEGGRQFAPGAESAVLPLAAEEGPARLLQVVHGERCRAFLLRHLAQVIALLAVGRDEGQVLVALGADAPQRLGVERSHVQHRLAQEPRPMEVGRRLLVDGRLRLVVAVVGHAEVGLQLGRGLLVALVGVVDHAHVVVRQGIGIVRTEVDTLGEVLSDTRGVEPVAHRQHPQPELRLGGLGVALGHAAHLLRSLAQVSLLHLGQGTAHGVLVAALHLDAALGLESGDRRVESGEQQEDNKKGEGPKRSEREREDKCARLRYCPFTPFHSFFTSFHSITVCLDQCRNVRRGRCRGSCRQWRSRHRRSARRGGASSPCRPQCRANARCRCRESPRRRKRS